MQLHYRQYSTGGHPLVILHGLYGNQANWMGLARQLAENFAVYGFDARNHGQSPWADSQRLEDMAEDVAQTLQMLGLTQVYLIGHSMGGKTAMLLAERRPDLVSKLVAVDIAPVDYHKRDDGIVQHLRQMPLAELDNRLQADAWLTQWVPEKSVRDFLLTNLVRDEAGNLRWRINLPVLERDFSEVAGWPENSGRFDGPVLFIRGGNSNYLLPKHEAATLAQFPQARIATVPGAGHWVHSEQPQQVLHLMREFLLEN
jgi:esterase